VEFPGSAIVSLRGFEFIVKIADLLSLAIDPNRGSPFLRLVVVPDASVFLRGVYLRIAGVSGVVGWRGKSCVFGPKMHL
jgi:hypothetical protein